MKNNNLAQIRRLAICLTISGAFNITLLAFFFYKEIRDYPLTPYQLKPVEEAVPAVDDLGYEELLDKYQDLFMDQLIAKLSDARLVENGYTHRDLALGCLVSLHHFDINRALAGFSEYREKRVVSIAHPKNPKKHQVLLFPGLSEEDYKAIIIFAASERWPITGEGMFESLKKPHLSQDQTLMEAFYLTPEFRTVELLFSRNDIPVEKAEILQVLFDGDWKRISLFTEQQKMLNDLSAVRRQKFLMDYVHEKSRAAAQLIVKTDADFAAKKLEDRDVKAILELLNRKSPASEKFALDLLTSPRSSPIWHLAAVRLYEFANEQVPEPFDQAQAIARFSPQHAHRNGQLNLPATLEPRTQASPASIASIDADSSRRLNSPKTTSTPVKTVSIIGGQAAAAQTAASSVNKISPKTAPRTVAQNQVPQKPAGDSKKETAFSAEKSPGKSQKKPVYSSPKELLYVVKPGDSLEKIAKRFEVDAEILKYYNRLSSNEINPGSTLRIPVMKIAKKK